MQSLGIQKIAKEILGGWSQLNITRHSQHLRTSANSCAMKAHHEGTPSLVGRISWKACGGHGSWIWKRKSAKSETEHPQPNPRPVRSRAKSHMVLFFRSNLGKNL
jgi:hypothetical protein